MNLNRALLLKLSEPLPFLDLFEQLRAMGMLLTLEQYDLLQRSLWRGYGSQSWSDLKQVCQVLWVKPSANYDRTLFEQEFQKYEQEANTDVEDIRPPQPSPSTIEDESTKPRLPQVPVRLMPERTKLSALRGPIGIKTPEQDRQLSGRDWKLTPMSLPISVQKVQKSWQMLQQVSSTCIADEIDVERTLEQISRLGFLMDVVLRSSWQQQAELVVLVDDGDGMIPYLPALKPLFQAIAGGWVSPARIYRFTGYPLRFLYDWERSTQAEAVDVILSRLHRTRTMVLVVSDAGAAIGTQNEDRIKGTVAFLERWLACVRQILWINPVPEVRWTGTPATEIQAALGGRMLALDAFDGAAVKQVIQTIGVQSGRWGQEL
jgi:uncharacterized protein